MLIAKSLFCLAVGVLLITPSMLAHGQSRDLERSPIREVGRCDFGVAYDVFVEGRIAYVSGNRGVHIIDVQDPSRPTRIGQVELSDGAFGLYVERNIAFIAGQKSGVFIVDVSDPRAPEIIGSYSEYKGIHHQDIVVRKNRGFISLRDGRLIILDTSDMGQPRRIGELKAGAAGRELAIYQDVVYFANAFGGLEIIEMSDPSSPRKIGTVPGTNGVSSMDIHGQILFLGCHANGVKILDISNSRLPKVIGAFNDGGESNSVFYHDRRLFVADQNDRVIEVLNVNDPARPYKLAEFDNDRYIPHDVFFDGQYIYTADAENGLVIFKYDPPPDDSARRPLALGPGHGSGESLRISMIGREGREMIIGGFVNNMRIFTGNLKELGGTKKKSISHQLPGAFADAL